MWLMRVEIVTPGGLPAGMREEDLGSKSVPRNPLLFSTLYRMKLVEQIGSGIRRIHDACLEQDATIPADHPGPAGAGGMDESSGYPEVGPRNRPGLDPTRGRFR